jgi:hypothetical protein
MPGFLNSSQVQADELPTNWDPEFKEMIQVVPMIETQTFGLGNVLASYSTSHLRYFDNLGALQHFPADTAPIYEPNELPASLAQLDQVQLQTAWPYQSVDSIRGGKYNFTTFIEIPSLVPGVTDGRYQFVNLQAMTKLGNYFYIVSVISDYDIEGRYLGSTDSAVVIRLDATIAALEAQDGLGIARVFREANLDPQWNKIPYEVFSKYAPYIKVSAPFSLKGSHGQIISNDGANVWVGMDTPMTNSNARNMSLVKFTPDLQVEKIYNFRLNIPRVSDRTYQWSYVSFAGPGHFYAMSTLSSGYAFFEGWIDEMYNEISVQMLPNIMTERIGPVVQNMSYNPGNGRLYLVADGVIATFPPAVLSASIPSWRSVQYAELNTLRESEGLAFDDDGKTIYWLVLHSPAIFRSAVNDFAAFDYDVSLSQRADDILWLMDNQYAQGTLEDGVTTFRPDNLVNRGAMAEFLYNIVGRPTFKPSTEQTQQFKDIKKLSEQRRQAIYWLGHQKITVGCNKKGDKYCPADPVNRGSMAQFLARMAKVKNKPTENSEFADVFSGESKTITYIGLDGAAFSNQVNGLNQQRISDINWLATTGITVGSLTDSAGQSTYRAQDPVNRGAMAQFLRRWKER